MSEIVREVRISPQQRIALDALLAGGSGIYASRLAGVSETTIQRWKQDSEFQAAQDQATRAALDATCGALLTADQVDADAAAAGATAIVIAYVGSAHETRRNQRQCLDQRWLM